MRAICCLAAILLSAFHHSHANAEITAYYDPAFPVNLDVEGLANGNNIVRDSITGLEWLYPYALIDMKVFAYPPDPQFVNNYQHVSSLLGHGVLAGFRYATRAEVVTLFQHLGLPVHNYPGFSTIDGWTAYNEALPYLGSNEYFHPRYLRTSGITSDPTPDGTGRYVASTQRYYTVSSDEETGTSYSHDFTDTNFSDTVSDTATWTPGHWLVRDTNVVPEPSTIALWGMGGLTLLIGAACRRRGQR